MKFRLRLDFQSVDKAKPFKISILLDELLELRIFYFCLAGHQSPQTLKEAMDRANAVPKEEQNAGRQNWAGQGRDKWALED